MPLRPMGQEQLWMLPPRLDELLPLDLLARFVAELPDIYTNDAAVALAVANMASLAGEKVKSNHYNKVARHLGASDELVQYLEVLK